MTREMEQGEYLECEKGWVFAAMIFVGGYFGAFTYSIRGGVFCNAQTANFVLFAMALGNGQWQRALYYLIPMSAYFLGAFLSESIAYSIKRLHFIRWDTLLVAIEMGVVVLLGALPESVPYQVTQVLINLICSMQYNTFRQAQGIPMATTFCTNHLRQVGIALCKALRHRQEGDGTYVRRALSHGGMLLMFVLGGIVSTLFCRLLLGRALWLALIPLGVVLGNLLYADLRRERDKLDLAPRGH